MPHYVIDSLQSEVTVVARSAVHNTKTVISGVRGSIDADPESLGSGAAQAEIAVDMTTADAGDWLKNRKLRKDLQLAANPTAHFSLSSLTDVQRHAERFHATAEGTLSWNGREIAIRATGEGRVNLDHIQAVATFEIDVNELGVVPPKILMFKVEEVVEINVVIAARAGGS